MWSSIAAAALIMGGMGLLFATILAVAWRFLRVPEDPRVEAVEGMLPGSNCGACGQPGCRAFAEALVTGKARPSGCTASSEGVVEQVADLLGVDPGAVERRVARLHCGGGRRETSRLASYTGHPTCKASATVSAGGLGCPWGCLGFGDCVRSCTFDAMSMNEDGLPVVDVERCTACGACVEACPRELFEIIPRSQHLMVQCSSPLVGEEARRFCRVACDACGRCAADAPEVITMVDGLPVVQLSEDGGGEREEAVLRCPTGAICWVEGRQFARQEPGWVPRSRHVGNA